MIINCTKLIFNQQNWNEKMQKKTALKQQTLQQTFSKSGKKPKPSKEEDQNNILNQPDSRHKKQKGIPNKTNKPNQFLKKTTEVSVLKPKTKLIIKRKQSNQQPKLKPLSKPDTKAKKSNKKNIVSTQIHDKPDKQQESTKTSKKMKKVSFKVTQKQMQAQVPQQKQVLHQSKQIKGRARGKKGAQKIQAPKQQQKLQIQANKQKDKLITQTKSKIQDQANTLKQVSDSNQQRDNDQVEEENPMPTSRKGKKGKKVIGKTFKANTPVPIKNQNQQIHNMDSKESKENSQSKFQDNKTHRQATSGFSIKPKNTTKQVPQQLQQRRSSRRMKVNLEPINEEPNSSQHEHSKPKSIADNNNNNCNNKLDKGESKSEIQQNKSQGEDAQLQEDIQKAQLQPIDRARKGRKGKRVPKGKNWNKKSAKQSPENQELKNDEVDQQQHNQLQANKVKQDNSNPLQVIENQTQELKHVPMIKKRKLIKKQVTSKKKTLSNGQLSRYVKMSSTALQSDHVYTGRPLIFNKFSSPQHYQSLISDISTFERSV